MIVRRAIEAWILADPVGLERAALVAADFSWRILQRRSGLLSYVDILDELRVLRHDVQCGGAPVGEELAENSSRVDIVHTICL